MQMLVSYACSYNLPLPPHSLCPGHPPTQCSDATYLLHTACFTAYFTEDILLLLTLRTMLRSCYISRAHCTSLHMSHYCTLHTLHAAHFVGHWWMRFAQCAPNPTHFTLLTAQFAGQNIFLDFPCRDKQNSELLPKL